MATGAVRVLDGFPGLLVACGVLVAGAAGVLVAVAISHWMAERAARRDHASDAVAPQLSPEPTSRSRPPLPPPHLATRLRPVPPTPGPTDPGAPQRPPEPVVSNADMRRWARARGLHVADRGPIPARIRQAWLAAHRSSGTS